MQSVDLSALGAQALAQVEKARKAAAESLASALNHKPKLDLTLELDAPKIAIPVPATEDGKGGYAHPQLLLCHALNLRQEYAGTVKAPYNDHTDLQQFGHCSTLRSVQVAVAEKHDFSFLITNLRLNTELMIFFKMENPSHSSTLCCVICLSVSAV